MKFLVWKLFRSCFERQAFGRKQKAVMAAAFDALPDTVHELDLEAEVRPACEAATPTLARLGSCCVYDLWAPKAMN